MPAPATRPIGSETTGSSRPATAPIAAPVRTGLVDGCANPCCAMPESSALAFSARFSGSLIALFPSVDREACGQIAHLLADMRFDLPVAFIAIATQAVDNLGDPV